MLKFLHNTKNKYLNINIKIGIKKLTIFFPESLSQKRGYYTQECIVLSKTWYLPSFPSTQPQKASGTVPQSFCPILCWPRVTKGHQT